VDGSRVQAGILASLIRRRTFPEKLSSGVFDDVGYTVAGPRRILTGLPCHLNSIDYEGHYIPFSDEVNPRRENRKEW
jgi:hypothetical protein